MKIIKRHESNDAATFWAWVVRGKTAMSFVCKRGQSKEGGHELSELKTEKTEEEEEGGKDDIAVFRSFPERRQHRLPRL